MGHCKIHHIWVHAHKIILRQKAQLEPTDDNENTSIIGVGIIGKMIIGG